MRQGGSPERIRLGSLIAIREAKIAGFSIAEMLVVMLIMSFIVIGVPAIHFKKNEVKTKRSLHGRFECYYNGNTLMSYYVNEEGASETPAVGGEGCKFTPPKNAVYLLIHAVGGGGGGSTFTGSKTVSPKTENNTYTTANDFPEWMREVQGFGKLPLPTTMPPSYVGKRQGSYATIRYGLAGKAGQTQSIFFPKLTNVEITMQPGKGGGLGQPGEATIVKFNGEDVPILKAEGGAGGTGSGDYPMWLDGRGSICQVKELEGRKQNLSDFTDSIEMDENTDMVSRITDIQAGSGGAGGYGNITTDYNVTYTIRAGGTGTDVDVSNYVNKITCDDPSRCEDGTQSDTCAAQAGKNGAVVILW